jgi:hypothetical protein
MLAAINLGFKIVFVEEKTLMYRCMLLKEKFDAAEEKVIEERAAKLIDFQAYDIDLRHAFESYISMKRIMIDYEEDKKTKLDDKHTAQDLVNEFYLKLEDQFGLDKYKIARELFLVAVLAASLASDPGTENLPAFLAIRVLFDPSIFSADIRAISFMRVHSLEDGSFPDVLTFDALWTLTSWGTTLMRELQYSIFEKRFEYGRRFLLTLNGRLQLKEDKWIDKGTLIRYFEMTYGAEKAYEEATKATTTTTTPPQKRKLM